MKRLLKNNRGMTLMEILVALSLLMIIIVGTTPVMLQAYDGLYTAGEYTQDTYEAKSEIEEKLATRNTRNVYPGFVVNFNNLGEVATLNGRRAVSSLKGSLETLFSNARVRVAIISSKTVNDDYSATGFVGTVPTAGWHEIVLQTTNLDFGTTDPAIAQGHLSLNTTGSIVDGGSYDQNDQLRRIKKVDLTFMVPDKTAPEGSIYTYNEQAKPGCLARVDYNNIKVDPITGRITVRINGFDFTQSPIKIYVAYLDENDKRQTTETYLYVDPPTIIAAGKVGTYDYYTSPGVRTKTVTNKNAQTGEITKTQVEEFGFYGRTMRTSGATGTQAIPSGTIFKSVNWITETTAAGELVGSVYSPSYYVLTGTNGAIYRTYSFVKTGSVAGKVNLDTTDAQFNGINQAGMTDVMGIVDTTIQTPDIDVFPAVWGGDFSHIFGYSSYSDKVAYTDSNTWYTENATATNTGVGIPGYYSNKARFAYYYDGFGVNFSYYTQRSKKVSYILTEAKYALRVGGFMGDIGHYDTPLNRVWERPITWTGAGSYTSQKQEKFEKGLHAHSITDWHSGYTGYYYYKKDDSLKRVAIVEIDASDECYSATSEADYLPAYFANNSSNNSADNNRRNDDGFAQLRIKHLSTISPTFFYDRWNEQGGEDGESGDTESGVKFVFNNTVNKSRVNVTDSVYIPQTSTTPGGVFYVGTVTAYSLLNQLDNVGGNNDDADRICNDDKDNKGAVSSYFIQSNNDCTSTTIYKRSNSVKGTIDTHGYFQSVQPKNETGVKVNESAAHNFFVTRATTETKSCVLNDVLFTMGFSSNREMVYSNIVYGLNSTGSIQESYKSYEPYYFLSHYDNADYVPNLYLVGQTNTYLNKANNDYYNVWFPGEMYNLTKIATKEGVTVAVGYAVSGSTYTYINETNTGNASTALGGIYNDGVLAAMVLGSDTSFKNLLYFKDKDNFDDSSLSSKAGYNTVFTAGYGTHTRDSVQFTAVDIGIQRATSGTTETSTYYAYYADNKGRVFRSKVATRSSSSSSAGTPTKVSHIADEAYNDKRNSPSFMEQLTLPGSVQFADLFDAITSITIEGNMIFISGKPNQTNKATINGKGVPSVVGMVDENTGEIEWIIIYCEAAIASDCWVEDLLVLDGYLYLAGRYVGPDSVTTHDGFIAAVSVAEVRSILMSRTTSASIEHIVDLNCVNVPDEIYAIDGHN